MKHAIKSILAGGTLLAAASAAQAELEVEVTAGYHSIYEFRGNDLGDDLFSGSIDLSYDLGKGYTLSGGIWYGDVNDGTAAGGLGNFEEVDYYISLSKSFGPVDLSIGYTYYNFPDASGTDSREWFVSASTELVYGVGLSVTFYDDYDSSTSDAVEGEYLEVVFNKSFEICACASLDLAAGAAFSWNYNNDVDGTGLDGFSHYYVSAAVPYAVTEKFTVTPYIKFVGVSDNFANSANGDSEDILLGGVSLSYSF